MKKVIAFAALALLGTGCATNTPYTYQEHRSEAFNIARAGGLHKDIRDTEVPADAIGSVTETMLKVGFVGAGYMKPALGMTNWQTMGLNLLAESTGLDTHGQRNSLLAWMPDNVASNTEDAQKALIDLLDESIQATLDEAGAEYERILEMEIGPGIEVTYLYVKDEWSCPEWSPGKLKTTCRIQFRVQPPKSGVAPTFTATTEGQHHLFRSGHNRHYNRIDLLTSDASSVPENELYASISRNLPKWVYFYLAPSKVNTEDSGVIEFPYILNGGEAKLFVIPK